jgi:predicted nucleic acid-binding protein
VNEIKSHYLDASVLVKYVSKEPKSDSVRDLFKNHSVFISTEFCIFEALNVLKSKWKYKKQMDKKAYLSACDDLLRTVGIKGVRVK